MQSSNASQSPLHAVTPSSSASHLFESIGSSEVGGDIEVASVKQVEGSIEKTDITNADEEENKISTATAASSAISPTVDENLDNTQQDSHQDDDLQTKQGHAMARQSACSSLMVLPLAKMSLLAAGTPIPNPSS